MVVGWSDSCNCVFVMCSGLKCVDRSEKKGAVTYVCAPIRIEQQNLIQSEGLSANV